MREITLTNGKKSLVSDNKYKFISQWKWTCSVGGYAIRRETVNGKRVTKYMHTEIKPHPKGMETDHIDGDKLNNQDSNLRVCHHYQNSKNRVISKNNTSGYKGVSFHKLTGRYQASIRINYKRVYLGLFDTPELAAVAYDKEAVRQHRKYASLNFKGEQ